MSVLHPFSAASKPMQDWDSMPSRPLQFAATIYSTDGEPIQSVPPLARIPRPRRHGLDAPRKFTPVPPQSPISSLSRDRNNGSPVMGSPNTRRPPTGSDEWMQMMVAHCVDHAKGDLELTGLGLEQLSTKISDLQHLVTLPPSQSPKPSPASRRDDRLPVVRGPATLSDRSFSRTQSAPASAAFFSTLSRSDARPSRQTAALLPSPDIPIGADIHQTDLFNRPGLNRDSRRRFERSKTGLGTDFSKRLTPTISVYLSQNRLTSLPSVLFEIKYLTVLSLRNNQLCSLPAAIGELVHLKELNISNNKIEYLPSTILNLSLEQLSAHNNKWRSSPSDSSDAPVTLSSLATRVLSPIRTIDAPWGAQLSAGTLGGDTSPKETVPRLTSLCLTLLLSPRPPSALPPLLEGYDWDSCIRGGVHPLLAPRALMEHIPVPSLRTEDAARMLQCTKSVCAAALRRGGQDHFPRSHLVPPPDDATTNPYYNPCPSPRHREWEEGFPSNYDSSPRRIFLHPAEERFEWVNICGEKDLPIQWLGCSPGCLAFLDEEDDELLYLEELEIGGSDL